MRSCICVRMSTHIAEDCEQCSECLPPTFYFMFFDAFVDLFQSLHRSFYTGLTVL